MDKIENNLDKIKEVMLSKEKVDELGNKCLYKMQILYDSLNDFIYWESCFWDKIDLEKKEIIIKQWHYDVKADIKKWVKKIDQLYRIVSYSYS